MRSARGGEVDRCIREASKDNICQCFTPESKLDTSKDALIKLTVSDPLFKPPMAGFTKPHVDAAINDCRCTQMIAYAEKLDEERVLLRLKRW